MHPLAEAWSRLFIGQAHAAARRLLRGRSWAFPAPYYWARRDPTPGTPENEFKDEHYRRIEFANKHFQTASGTPGWKTDRGHIYIVYGPPDEIDSHPSGTGNAAHGYELWTYRHVEGVGDNVSITFVDDTGRRDYRIAPTGAR